MSTFGFIEYEDASPQVRAVYEDIKATRKTDYINNFWKAIAHDPALLKRTWEDLKATMKPGALDLLTKELIYIAVSVTNNCQYCIYSHTSSAFSKGMTPKCSRNCSRLSAWPTKPTSWSPDIRFPLMRVISLHSI